VEIAGRLMSKVKSVIGGGMNMLPDRM